MEEREMTVTIELPPELARRLEEEASRRGQDVTDCARMLLAERLMLAGGEADRTLLPGGVRRRSPAELLALAREQGVRPVEKFEDLLGDWSDAEGEEGFDVDAFLEARRQWQQEGGPGFPFDDPAATKRLDALLLRVHGGQRLLGDDPALQKTRRRASSR
jgi:hypothetical protein